MEDIAKPVEYVANGYSIWERLDGKSFYVFHNGERIGAYRRRADARRAARRMAEKNPK